MKIEKEKGIFRRFLEWLKTPDEDEIEGGEINIRAFAGEDKGLINELNGAARRVDYTASATFKEKRVETMKKMKAEVKTPNPNMKAKGKGNPIIENYLEQ